MSKKVRTNPRTGDRRECLNGKYMLFPVKQVAKDRFVRNAGKPDGSLTWEKMIHPILEMATAFSPSSGDGHDASLYTITGFFGGALKQSDLGGATGRISLKRHSAIWSWDPTSMALVFS